MAEPRRASAHPAVWDGLLVAIGFFGIACVIIGFMLGWVVFA